MQHVLALTLAFATPPRQAVLSPAQVQLSRITIYQCRAAVQQLYHAYTRVHARCPQMLEMPTHLWQNVIRRLTKVLTELLTSRAYFAGYKFKVDFVMLFC